MWQREQKLSTSEPGRDTVYISVPISNCEAHWPSLAKGLRLALGVPSGGGGVSHSPLAEISRASRRKAARQRGSRHALDIIEPFHSSKIFLWQVWHCPGLALLCQYSS